MWGDGFVQGHDSKGKLTCDVLLTCDFDAKVMLEEPIGPAILRDEMLEIRVFCTIVLSKNQ
jgi:hypothetical protein